MNTTQKIIYTGFAACALASASMPAFSWTVGPRADWDNTFGRPATTVELTAPGPGYVWVPGHYRDGSGKVWVEDAWVKDESTSGMRVYSNGRETIYTNASDPTNLRDRDGNVIPITPEAYPIDSPRR